MRTVLQIGESALIFRRAQLQKAMKGWDDIPPSINKAFEEFYGAIKPPLASSAFYDELEEIKNSAKQSLLALVRVHLDAKNLKIEHDLKNTAKPTTMRQVTEQAKH